jgi:hypothetical protein
MKMSNARWFKAQFKIFYSDGVKNLWTVKPNIWKAGQ